MTYHPIAVGERILVGDPDYDAQYYCEECEIHIGWDEYEMGHYAGNYVTVEKIWNDESSRYFDMPGCGAEVFSFDGWLWTTCWCNRQRSPQTPSWEV